MIIGRLFFVIVRLATMYKFESGNFNGFSDVMLKNLKDNFPTVNFVGIRLLAPRDANGFIKLYNDTITLKLRNCKLSGRKKSLS